MYMYVYKHRNINEYSDGFHAPSAKTKQTHLLAIKHGNGEFPISAIFILFLWRF